MSMIDKAKLLLAIFALCLLSSLMTEKEPVKYERGLLVETAQHAAWVKRQHWDDL
jgi:hypothetical protein